MQMNTATKTLADMTSMHFAATGEPRTQETIRNVIDQLLSTTLFPSVTGGEAEFAARHIEATMGFSMKYVA